MPGKHDPWQLCSHCQAKPHSGGLLSSQAIVNVLARFTRFIIEIGTFLTMTVGAYEHRITSTKEACSKKSIIPISGLLHWTAGS